MFRLAIACLLSISPQAPTRDLVLEIGDPEWGFFAADDPEVQDRSRTQILSLQPAADGIVTFSAGSLDFDVFLKVETESGEPKGRDDDGGLETDARFVTELRKGGVYRVFVGAKPGGSGWYWVRCQWGESPLASKEADLIAAETFHETQAGTALARGDVRSAAMHFVEKGKLLGGASRPEDARKAWRSALSLWRDLGEKRQEAEATLEVGRLACLRKDGSEAEACASEALAICRALPDPTGEARALLLGADGRAAIGDAAAALSRYGEARVAAAKAGDAELVARALGAVAELQRGAENRRGEWTTLLELGRVWREQRRLEKALECHGRAREVAAAAGDRAGEGAAWSELGEDWLGARDWTHARECLEKALEIARKSGDKRAEARACGDLGRAWFGTENHDKALELHERELEAARDDPAGTRAATLRIGMCCLAREDYPRARACFEAELSAAVAAGERLEEGDALYWLSIVELRTGNLQKSFDLSDRHKECRRDLPEQTLRTRIEAGERHFSLGEVSQARGIFEACLRSPEVREDELVKSMVLYDLGLCHEARGRYVDAIRCFTEMVEISRALGRRLDEGQALDRLGVQYRAVGALDRAMECFDAALAIARETGDPYLALDAWNDSANVWIDREQFDQALEIYAKIGDLARKVRLELPELVGLNNLGVTYWETGRYDLSRKYLEQAVQGATEFGPREYLAHFRGNLARTLRKLGERERALELATSSLAVLHAPDSGEPRKALVPLEALIGFAIDDRDAETAKSWLGQANLLLEAECVQAQSTPGIVEVNPWLLCPPFDRCAQDLAHLLDSGEGTGAADRAGNLRRGFRDADRARARVLASGLVEHRRGTRKKPPLEVRARWTRALGQLDEKMQAISAAVRAGRAAEEIDRLRLEVDGLKKEAETLGTAFREISPKDALLDLPDGADPPGVRQAAVPQGCALIEYAEGDERLYAYVLTDRDLVLLELGQRREVDGAVRRYLASIGSQKDLANAATVAQQGRALYETLLAAPLARAGSGIARLVVIPTPSLAVLPFDALVADSKPEPRSFGELEFVIDRFEVDYCPSASILLTLSQKVGGTPLARKVLVLADPVYPPEAQAREASTPKPGTPNALLSDTRGEPDLDRLVRLAKTREEALAIADILVQEGEAEVKERLFRLRSDPGERSGSLHGRRIDLYLGSEASKDRLQEDLQPYAILHLAAHGWVDGRLPQQTGIALSGSGPDRYRGFVSIVDAVGMDLEANLVVLSACETARGSVRSGEGVESMANAFLQAGARRVVASLWQVVDWVASDTMRSFYAQVLNEGRTAAEALHRAKLAIRRGQTSRGVRPGDTGASDEGNPFYWAPFIHVGLPR